MPEKKVETESTQTPDWEAMYKNAMAQLQAKDEIIDNLNFSITCIRIAVQKS